MENYLEKLLSQIRCKKARPFIADEIRGHIESQIEDNLLSGMSSEEAEKNAVADMGDPVSVGVSLDKIHKPKLNWKLLFVVAVLSVLGILVQLSLCYHNSNYEMGDYIRATNQPDMTGFIGSVILGYIVMCCIYFVDYTTIAKYSKIIGLSIIVLGILCDVGFFGSYVRGVRYYIGFGVLY